MKGSKTKIDPQQLEGRAKPRVLTGTSVKLVVTFPDGRTVEYKSFEAINYTAEGAFTIPWERKSPK